MSDVFNLDREQNLKERIDPTGRKWEVHTKRGSSLYHARPNPDRDDAVIPSLFYGEWTKAELLLEKIDLYLTRAWDKSDAAAEDARRVKEAAKEQAKIKAAEDKAAAALGCADEVPVPAVDMTADEKEAVIQRAIDADNAQFASTSEAKRITAQKTAVRPADETDENTAVGA